LSGIKSIYGFGRGGVKLDSVRNPKEVVSVDKLPHIGVSLEKTAMQLAFISEGKSIERLIANGNNIPTINFFVI
jgi:hypothetical protein